MLKEYVDSIFRERDQQVRAALTSMEKRLDGMNEFRDTVSDQQSLFMPRSEYAGRHDQLIGELQRLRERMDQLSGAQATARRIQSALLASVGVAIALGTLITYIVVGHP